MDDVVAPTEWHRTIEDAYRTDGDRLWRAVYAFAGDADVASEAVAEAYAQALRRNTLIRDPAAWTWRAAFKIAAGALKARRQSETLTSDDVADGQVFDRYADPDLLAALRRLPDGQRAAVVLHYYADLAPGQIASRLGTNAVAVRANLSRGRRRLRDLLGDDDD